jgi:glycolate oxidase iron-sulfur subunit
MKNPGFEFDELLRTCIHCGLCLNDCPTYRLTGDEAHSPRGRIMVLRQILDPLPDNTWEPDRATIDMCLGCRGCETACPSGVPYGRLLEEGRALLPDPEERLARLVRLFTRYVIPRRRLLAVLAILGPWVSRLSMATGSLARLLSALPRRRASWPRIRGPREGNVAVLAGCAQPVFSPGVLPATLAIIRAAGESPFVPSDQGCCGALAAHAGDLDQARSLGRALIRRLESAESIVIPSAGCSAHLGRLGELFANDPEWGPRAGALASRCEDFVVWVHRNRERFRWRPDLRRVVFQRPCHLRHAQGTDGAAEQVLSGISGVELLETPRADLCCGSAGAWSLEYPELARRRRDEKMADLLAPGPEIILTGNPGCELFLDGGPEGVPVRHLAEYLAELLPGS